MAYLYPAMSKQRDEERRHDARYPLTLELRAAELSHLGVPKKRKGAIRGRIEDISSGGLCLLTDRLIKVSSLVRAETLFSDIPVGIPTLLRVQWTQKNARKQRYRIGLRFLI